MSEVFGAARVDPAVVDLVVQWRKRRGWPHLSAMFLGGAGAIIGSGSVVVRVLHRQDAHTLSFAAAAALYAFGCLVYAWGAAAGSARRFLRWFPLALIAGALLMAALIIAGIFSDFFEGSSGSGSDSSTQRSSPGRRARRTLAGVLVDRRTVEQIVGAPAEGPRPIGRVLLRSRSIALWRGPSPDHFPLTGPHNASLTITVRRSVKAARRVASATIGPPATPLPKLGDGGVLTHLTSSSARVSRVQGTRREWVVTISVRMPGPVGDVDAALIGAVEQALHRLDAADPLG